MESFRTSSSKVRSVPSNSTVSGTMLKRMPPLKAANRDDRWRSRNVHRAAHDRLQRHHNLRSR